MGWIDQILADAISAVADELDAASSRMWRRGGWTATRLERGMQFEGPTGQAVTYLLDGVDLAWLT
jgi:hypothetical protein